jgi:hypothetical protein
MKNDLDRYDIGAPFGFDLEFIFYFVSSFDYFLPSYFS